MRLVKTFAKRAIRSGFEIGQRLGWNILPAHFYSETPNIRNLRKENSWRKPLEMVGVSGVELQRQIEAFDSIFDQVDGVTLRELRIHENAVVKNGQGGGYGPIESEVLFAFIASRRPRKIVQIGCGVTTAIILRAIKYGGHEALLTCIEPYPSNYLRDAADAKRINLITAGAENVDQGIFDDLGDGDLLFVDSTHRVCPGSEVNRIVLDVLPRLASGVLVHFHDIYFPYDYQRGILNSEIFFHSESTLLHAFLIDNSKMHILFSLSMLHYASPNSILRRLPHYRPQQDSDGLAASKEGHFPSAVFLECSKS